MKPNLMGAVLDSFGRLCREADLVLVEGAGSASEINLRTGDIANLGFARAAGVPVVLVGDIDRGGVIASLVGTKAVIDPDDAAMIEGFIVNKFRGDPALFAEGMTAIERATGWPPLGLVPHFEAAAKLPAEDALALDRRAAPRGGKPAYRRSRLSAHLELRRFRSASPRARRRARLSAAGRADPRRDPPRHPAGLEGDHRRPRRASRRRLGRRSPGARASRRACARHLRRLSDARHESERPGGHRGPARDRRWPRLSRRRDHDAGREGAIRGRRRKLGRRGAVQGLRDARRESRSAQAASGRSSKSPAGDPTARSAQTAASPAATSTGSSPTTAIARTGSPASARSHRRSTTRLRSRRRSTRSLPTSSGTSTARVSSTSPATPAIKPG